MQLVKLYYKCSFHWFWKHPPHKISIKYLEWIIVVIAQQKKIMSPKITKILLNWPTNKNLSFVLFPTVITIPQVLLIFTWCYLKGYLYLPGATSRATYIYLVLPQGLLILTWCYLKGLLTWCYFKVLIFTFWHLKTTVVKQLFLYINWFDCIIV